MQTRLVAMQQAASTASQVTGAAVLLLILGACIFVGFRTKSLKMWEFILCTSFGFLLAGTGMSGALDKLFGTVGNFLLGIVS